MNIVVVGRYFLELGTFKFEISFKMIFFRVTAAKNFGFAKMIE